MTSSPWRVDPGTGDLIAPAGKAVSGITTILGTDAETRNGSEGIVAGALGNYYTKPETDGEISGAIAEQGTVSGQSVVSTSFLNVPDTETRSLVVPIGVNDLARMAAYISALQGGTWFVLDRRAIVERIGAAAPVMRAAFPIWEAANYEPRDPLLADQYFKSIVGDTVSNTFATVANNIFTVEAGDYDLSVAVVYSGTTNNGIYGARVRAGGVVLQEQEAKVELDEDVSFSLIERLTGIPAGTLDIDLQLEASNGTAANHYFAIRLVKRKPANEIAVEIVDNDATTVIINVTNISGGTIDDLRIAAGLFDEDIS